MRLAVRLLRHWLEAGELGMLKRVGVYLSERSGLPQRGQGPVQTSGVKSDRNGVQSERSAVQSGRSGVQSAREEWGTVRQELGVVR